ncbi:MAG: restriction endonuclease [Methanomassiliicoccaceae archaeon]|nr:restriction endonuclease [Methanomassiliicoccaceae archaeon]
MHIRKANAIAVDIIVCLALLLIVPYIYVDIGIYAFVIIPVALAARILLQKLVHNKSGNGSGTFRRTFFDIDPISFILFHMSITASVVIALREEFFYAAVVFTVISAFILIVSEYFWFADRPNRWYSFRYRIYKMKRNLHPTDEERLQKILVNKVDNIKGHDFERYVAELMTKNGFKKVKVTKGSGDFGVDITAILNKDIYAVQCKRSRSKIGIKAVQEAFLGKEHYKADTAIVVTNNYFTKQAYEAADGKIILWDREILSDLIQRSKDTFSNETDNKDKACNETEIKMFVALYDNGKDDIELTEKIMGTLYPAGNMSSEEDMNHFLKRITEHLYEKEVLPERRYRRIKNALEKGKRITAFEADIVCYHLTGTHTITMKDMNDVRNKLAKVLFGMKE